MRALPCIVIAAAVLVTGGPWGMAERRPAGYEPKVIATWTPEWPEPKPSFKVFYHPAGRYPLTVVAAWTWDAEGTVETDVQIVDLAHPTRALYKFMVPQGICGVGAKAGMRVRSIYPFSVKPGAYLQIRLTAKGHKASSPKWLIPVQKEGRQRAK